MPRYPWQSFCLSLILIHAFTYVSHGKILLCTIRFLNIPGNSASVAHTPVAVLLQLQMSDTMNNLEELLRLSGGDGQIFTVDGALCMKSVQAMFGYDWGGKGEVQTCFPDISTSDDEYCWPFLGGWLITHTHPSMLSFIVGTCRQMFRCSLDLSLW